MQKTRNYKKPHYAWWILASCIAFYSATMGALVNTQGIFMPPMLSEFGWSATQYSAASIISGLSAVAALTFVDKLYNRFGVKRVLLISVFLYELGFMLKTFTRGYLYYCGISALIGVSSAFVLYVPVPLLINAWFKEKRGFALGTAMLSSGVAGAVLNPIISGIISSSGWRIGIVAVSGIAMCISLPFLIFVVRGKPEDMGLRPYGEGGDAAEKANVNPDHGKEAEKFFSNRFSPKDKHRKLIICIIMAALLNLLSVISAHLANFAASLGLATAIGATLTSSQMIGNLLSKATMGLCMDRFGKFKVLLISMIFVTIGYLLLGLSTGAVILMYAAAFLLGITAAHNTMVMPAMVETFAIGREYAGFISKVSMGTMLASAFSNIITSSIYDLTGAYTTVWFVYAGIELVCAVLLCVFYRNKLKTL